MKKFIYLWIFMIIGLYNVFSHDILQYKDVKELINNSSDIEIEEYSKKIANTKIKWQGLICLIKPNDNESEMIFVEMEKPDRKKPVLVPDIMFILDKKISTRLSELQFIVFHGYIIGIEKIDNRFIIRIRDIYLQGIIK
jgi:hypothetical protein